MGIKIWLDDVRRPPKEDFLWLKNYQEVVELLRKKPNIESISFDHDLGLNSRSGYAVACYIEKLAYDNSIKRMNWSVHSANPVGATRIMTAMQVADSYWTRHEERRHALLKEILIILFGVIGGVVIGLFAKWLFGY